jgi:hypothetical protein
VNVPRQTDFSLRISSSCSLGVRTFTSTECIDRLVETPHLVGGAASILNLDQYQCNASTQILVRNQEHREALLFHTIERLLEKFKIASATSFFPGALDPFRLSPGDSLKR